MKKKKTLGARGRNKRETVRYTDEYIEDLCEDGYGEDMTV